MDTEEIGAALEEVGGVDVVDSEVARIVVELWRRSSPVDSYTVTGSRAS
jgi:hypothetical protein